MKKVLIIYGLLVVGIVIVAVLRFRGVDLLPNLGNNSAKVTINNHEFSVEVADNNDKRIKGLSARESLDKDKGMLFVFEEKAKHGFWMKNVNFPLDIIFISDKKIVDIAKNAEPKTAESTDIPVLTPKEDANYVLEINGGLADEYGLEAGNDVVFTGIQ